MNFKIGFLIKPNEILENNEITFISSSGVKPATYTESDCLAYGFIYNDSKCWSVQNSTSFLPPDNQNILQAGANNIIGVQSSDCTIIGINNELRFNDKNSLIVGDRNVINDDINNTIVSGTKGDATATNSIVLGGNTILAGTSPLGNELVLNGDFSEVGSDEVTNGDFATDLSGWSGATTRGSYAWDNGKAKITNDNTSGYPNLSQSVTTVSGKVYKVNATVEIGTSTLTEVRAYSGGILGSQQLSTDGQIEFYITAVGSSFTLHLYLFEAGNTGNYCFFDNVSVKEVGQDWDVANSDANNYVVFNGSTARLKFLNTSPITELRTNNNILQAGKTYKLTVDVASVTSGSIKFNTAGVNVTFNTVGIFTNTIIPNSNTRVVFYRASSNVDLTLNSVSVKEVFPYIAPRQSIKLMYGGTTTNDTSTPLYLNTIVDKYLNIPINTAMSFNADILALRVGGTAAGDNGDFASWIERGVIINKNGVISVSTTNTTVVSSGTTTGWIPSSAIPTSSELVTNGDFATDSNWNKNRNWTISGGVAIADGSSSNDMNQSFTIVVGTIYKVTYTVVSLNSGSFNFSLGGVVGNTITSIGTYSEEITAISTDRLRMRGASPNGTIDNVSVKEVIPPTGSTYNINVVGAVNTTIEWASTINFTQIKTNITL
tara:strand:- start:117 stop:2093 length:1977 start_codon:yes stop_codon:yes gene_type:complete